MNPQFLSLPPKPENKTTDLDFKQLYENACLLNQQFPYGQGGYSGL